MLLSKTGELGRMALMDNFNEGIKPLRIYKEA